jgi:hypothetical protein
MKTTSIHELIRACGTVESIARKIDAHSKKRKQIIFRLVDMHEHPTVKNYSERKRMKTAMEEETECIRKLYFRLYGQKAKLIGQLTEL